MSIFETVKKLCDDRNVKISVLERELKLGRGNIYKMKDSVPGTDKVEKIADFFGVSTDYLLGRTDNEGKINCKCIDASYDTLVSIYLHNRDKYSSTEKINLARRILSDVNDK